MKIKYSIFAAIFFAFVLNISAAKACLHFTESFTLPYIPSTYTTGTITLSSGDWEIANVRGEQSSNAYGAVGGAARLGKNLTASMISPSVNSIGSISFYYRTLNTSSGTFVVQQSINGGAFTEIATQAFSSQTYTLFTITLNDASNNIRIKILSDNNPENLIIDEFTINNYDITAPLVFANAQTVTNTGQDALVQSNEGDGYVYIIKDGIAQSNITDMDNAVTNLQGAKSAVTAANTDIAVSALNLETGNYFAYAVDCWGLISAKGTNIIEVIGSSVNITGVAFADGNYIIGDVMPVTITAGAAGYTAGTILINGQSAAGFTDNGDNTYSVSYTVQEGDPDAAQASDVPLSIVLMSGTTPSAEFTGPATGLITIDANRPLITVTERISNTSIKVTVSELLDVATITQANDGGFDVSDLNNGSIVYLVNAINPGSTNAEVILTVDDFSASELSGLHLFYGYGANGIITDVAGNYMMTDFLVPDIDPWTGTGIQNPEAENQISIYPNPTADQATISIFSDEATLVKIEQFNNVGQKIQTKQMELGLGANSISLDCTDFPAGMYFLMISSDNGKIMTTKQLVVQ